MFKHLFQAIASLCIFFLITPTLADDLDIYAGIPVTGSSPAELIFAIDTSASMACTPDQDFGIYIDRIACYFNVHPNVSSFDTSSLLVQPDPANAKVKKVKTAIRNALANTDVFPDTIRVGLAYYNYSGGSIVQPLRELSAATPEEFESHRALLLEELQYLPAGLGKTPILGTLLEIGQYLTSQRVIFGDERVADEEAEEAKVTDQVWDLGNSYGFNPTEGYYARISHERTVANGTINRSLDCLSAIENNPVTGLREEACFAETFTGANIRYNENINKATVCADSDSGNVQVTTQIVLVTDGLPTGENMSETFKGASVGTWVKRFVTGDSDALGYLASGEGAEGFPEIPDFTDLGCPSTANIKRKATDEEKKQYVSCLFHVANRFRELGVKINVVGFALPEGQDQAGGVDNTLLRTIADITGGQFLSTNNADQLQTFFNDLGKVAIESSSLSVPLSPSVSVNPGIIQANADEVYLPLFSGGNRSFLYGNLRKYKIKENSQGGVDLEGANGIATETCSGSTDYICFKDGSYDFWSNTANGNVVTRGGAAEKQEIYGPRTSGNGRKIFLQNGTGTHNLQELSLISLNSTENQDSPDSGGPYHVEDTSITDATKNYYANLVVDPSTGASFVNYQALVAADDDSLVLRRNEQAYDFIRWLNGYDKPRFMESGDTFAYSPTGTLRETDIVEKYIEDSDSSSATTATEDETRRFYGAVVHSQPTVVNYGYSKDSNNNYTYDNTIFVSGNDGFLRAIDADDGTEEFSFFPQALVGKIPTMYKNPVGDFNYGLDSTWTVWRQDLPDENGNFDGQINNENGPEDSHGFVRLYGGMRRGGYSYYFLDVTNRNSPKLIKEINKTVTPFEGLGQTWSQPVLAKIKKPGQSFPTVVAIFGGGYDPDYDKDDASQTAGNDPCRDTDTQTVICGNQIFMVEAGGYTSNDDYGSNHVVWWVSNSGTAAHYTGPASTMHAVVDNMNHSIPAKVKTIDIDDDGLVDRIYVGDLGGQIFRVKINNNIANATDSENNFITISTLAQVGHEGFTDPDAEDNRMFFETPSVALMNNNGNKYVGVAIASGWRSKPGDKTVKDEFYFFRDTLSGDMGTLQRPATSADSPNGTEDFITHIETLESFSHSSFDAAKAFALSLNYNGDYAGEKAIGAPIILEGHAFFPTYIPPSDDEIAEAATTCSIPNRSRVTAVKLQGDAPDFINNVSAIKTPTTEGVIFGSTEADGSVPLNGLGVHISHDRATILAGTKSINISLTDEKVKKTKWRLLESGSAAIPDDPVALEQ